MINFSLVVSFSVAFTSNVDKSSWLYRSLYDIFGKISLKPLLAY